MSVNRPTYYRKGYKAPMGTLGQRLRQAREQAGLSQSELARRVGIKQPTVSDLEQDKSKDSRYTVQLAKATGANATWLATGRGEMATREPLADYEFLRDVPIIGCAKAGHEDGHFEQIEMPDATVQFNTRDDQAYALIIRGDSMSPRIRAGEIIVVTPSREPHPGDDVIVATTSGRKMVKHFLYRRQGTVALGSINEAHSIITLPDSEIEGMHYVAGRLPPSAVREILK